MYVLGQKGLYLRIILAREILRSENGRIDAPHGLLEMAHGALLGCDDGLPVPLVYVERVYIVKLLIGSYGVHVGVDAVAGLYAAVGQREPLPFGQRVHHFGCCSVHVLDVERHGSLHAVQIVVDA